MSNEWIKAMNPRVRSAIAELEAIIQQRWPSAAFEVSSGEDNPEAIHLTATVDVEDTDEVLDVVVTRLLELQVEERLPIHVIPVRRGYCDAVGNRIELERRNLLPQFGAASSEEHGE